jgi:ankyrin repeat protein
VGDNYEIIFPKVILERILYYVCDYKTYGSLRLVSHAFRSLVAPHWIQTIPLNELKNSLIKLEHVDPWFRAMRIVGTHITSLALNGVKEMLSKNENVKNLNIAIDDLLFLGSLPKNTETLVYEYGRWFDLPNFTSFFKAPPSLKKLAFSRLGSGSESKKNLNIRYHSFLEEFNVNFLKKLPPSLLLCEEDALYYNKHGIHTPLTLAITKGATESDILEMIKNGADINKVLNDGNSPLKAACLYAIDKVPLLLKNGAKPTDPNYDNPKYFCSPKYPIFAACQKVNDHITLPELVKHGADINIIENKRTLLQECCVFSNITGASFLLKNGADPNKYGGSEKFKPLNIAITRGDKPLLELLLNFGANAKSQSEDPSEHILYYLLKNPNTKKIKRPVLEEILELLCDHKPSLYLNNLSDINYFYVHNIIGNSVDDYLDKTGPELTDFGVYVIVMHFMKKKNPSMNENQIRDILFSN